MRFFWIFYLSWCHAVRERDHADEVLFGPLGPKIIHNLAADAPITSTSTCGLKKENEFCVDGTHDIDGSGMIKGGLVCYKCSPATPRLITNAVTGTQEYWVSEMNPKQVDVTVDLRQAFFIASVKLTYGPSGKPHYWTLMKSLDNVTYTPWRHIVDTNTTCNKLGMSPSVAHGIGNVGCEFHTTEESRAKIKVVQLLDTKNSMIVSEDDKEIRDWIKARYIRISFQEPFNYNSYRYQDDITFGRIVYYSLKGIYVSGHCICQGLSSKCEKDPKENLYKCICMNNTCGEQCEICCKGFYMTPESKCEACTCFNHTNECFYDQKKQSKNLVFEMVKPSFVETCVNCQNNTSGDNCEMCKEGFYRNRLSPKTEKCEDCSCDLRGSLNNTCNDEGKCHCLQRITGDKCSECFNNHWKFPYCSPCDCSSIGSYVEHCNKTTGQCDCRSNITGRTCNECPGKFTLTNDGCLNCIDCAEVLVGETRQAIGGTYYAKRIANLTVEEIKERREHYLQSYSDKVPIQLLGFLADNYYWCTQALNKTFQLELELWPLTNKVKTAHLYARQLSGRCYGMKKISLGFESGVGLLAEEVEEVATFLHELANSFNTRNDLSVAAAMEEATTNLKRVKSIDSFFTKKIFNVRNHYKDTTYWLSRAESFDIHLKHEKKRCETVYCRLDRVMQSGKAIIEYTTNVSRKLLILKAHSLRNIRKINRTRVVEIYYRKIWVVLEKGKNTLGEGWNIMDNGKEVLFKAFEPQGRLLALITELDLKNVELRWYIEDRRECLNDIRKVNCSKTVKSDSLIAVENALRPTLNAARNVTMSLDNLSDVVVYLNESERHAQYVINILDEIKSSIELKKASIVIYGKVLEGIQTSTEVSITSGSQEDPDDNLKEMDEFSGSGLLPTGSDEVGPALINEDTDGKDRDIFISTNGDSAEETPLSIPDDREIRSTTEYNFWPNWPDWNDAPMNEHNSEKLESRSENLDLLTICATAKKRSTKTSVQAKDCTKKLQALTAQIKEKVPNDAKLKFAIIRAVITAITDAEFKKQEYDKKLIQINNNVTSVVKKLTYLKKNFKKRSPRVKGPAYEVISAYAKVKTAEEAIATLNSSSLLQTHQVRLAKTRSQMLNKLKSKIDKLRSKIQNATRIAQRFKGPVTFSSPGFSSIILPSTIIRPSPITTLQVDIRSDFDDGLILRSNQSSNGLYFEMKLHNSTVQVCAKLVNTMRCVRMKTQVFSGQWFRVQLKRIGNIMSVAMMVNGSIAEFSKIDWKQRDIIIPINLPIFVGGLPEEFKLKKMNDFDGVLQMKVNDYDVNLLVACHSRGLQTFYSNDSKTDFIPDTLISFVGEGFHKNITNSSIFPIKLNFRSSQKNGLLIYSQGAHKEDYIAVYIKNGAVHISYNVKKTSFHLKSHRHTYHDNKWHKIKIYEKGMTWNFEVDDGDKESTVLYFATPFHVRSVLYGGLDSVSREITTDYNNDWVGFVGCLDKITFNDEIQNVQSYDRSVNTHIGSCHMPTMKCACVHSDINGINIHPLPKDIGFVVFSFKTTNAISSILAYNMSLRSGIDIFHIKGVVNVRMTNRQILATKYGNKNSTLVNDGLWHSLLLVKHNDGWSLTVDETVTNFRDTFTEPFYDSQHHIYLGRSAKKFRKTCFKDVTINYEIYELKGNSLGVCEKE